MGIDPCREGGIMSITNFISGGKSKVQSFEEQRRGKTKKEVRQLEQTMLVPDKLPPFTKPKTHKDSVTERSVRLVFPDQKSFDLFKKHFKVSTYKENNALDISLLIRLLEALDAGKIDVKTGHKSPPVKPRNCKRGT